MDDKYSGIPGWIQSSKKSLKQTQEWQTYMMKLYDLVHHQMQEMGVGSFNDLAPPERNVILQRGFQALRTSDAYFQLLQTTSESLDQSVSKEADKLSITKQQNRTKIEILQEECHKAITSLLEKWPDSRTSLRQCLNADIPLELRYVMWKNFLKSPKAREEYLKLVASDPKKLVSKLDFEISERCQKLIESDPTLKQIPNRKAACSVMRHLLSYRHTRISSQIGLIETDYLLAVPLVYCTMSARHSVTHNSTQQLTTETLATLVEEFDAFMDKRPGYMMLTQGPSLNDLSRKTGEIIRKHEPNLAKVIETYKIGQKDPPIKKIDTVLALLLHSVVRSMFVGYFPLESVLHTWDLIVLGFDHSDYDPVPYVCACVFIILRGSLLKCKSEKEAMTVIIQGCRGIHKEKLMLAMRELGFEKQLKEILNIAEEDRFPVFHPALKSNLPPWKHWYSSKLISYVQDERSEASRKRAIPIQDQQPLLSPGSSRLDNGHAGQVWQLEQVKSELEEETERLREERDILAANVEEERRLRIETQQQADEEIERLRRQLNALQRSKKERPSPAIIAAKPSPIASPIKEKTPPPEKSPTPPPEPKPLTPKPKTPVKDPTPAPKTPEQTPEEKAKARRTADDFLLNMMAGINLVAHGDKKDRRDLDKMTQKDLQKLTDAFKKAQINIYGKTMTDSEMQTLPERERNEKNAKMQDETLRLLFKKK